MDEESLIRYTQIFATILFVLRLFFHIRNQFHPLKIYQRHVLITGADSSLGKELTKECLSKEARITLISKNRDEVIAFIGSLSPKEYPDIQDHVQIFEKSLIAEKIEQMIDQSESSFGNVFLYIDCDESKDTGYFFETPISSFRAQIEENYLGLISYLLPISKRMCRTNMGHICIIGSSHSYLPIPGEISWAVSKAAVSGIADSIRPELSKYNVKVHMFSPGPILNRVYKLDSPLELQEMPLTPKVACEILINGISAGDKHITTNEFNNLLKITSLGAQARDNVLLDVCFSWLSVFVGHFSAVYLNFRVISI